MDRTAEHPSGDVRDGSQDPEVSVVIAYYAAARWLPAQLEALATQRDAPRFEVVIADNEGSIELPAVIAPFLNQLNIRVVDATSRRGCGAARNQGVAAARGAIVAFCDADDVIDTNWLSMISGPVVASDVLAAGSLRLDVINSESAWRTAVRADPDAEVEPPVLQIPFKDFDYRTFAYGGNCAIRRSSFLGIGGIREDFSHGGEDIDFSWRSAECGTPVVVLQNAVINYRVRDTPRAVFRQHRSYGRAEVDIWITSRQLARPVRGMSLRWTLDRCLRLPVDGLKAILATEDDRYRFAAHAGDMLGNLQGQIERRVVPALRHRIPGSGQRNSEATR